jgi:DNA recombination protein RmuC
MMGGLMLVLLAAVAWARTERATAQRAVEVERSQGALLAREVEQLRAQTERIGRLEAERDAAQRLELRCEGLELELREALELGGRRQAELRTAAERREELHARLSVIEPLEQRVAALSAALSRSEALLEAERVRFADLERSRPTMRLEFEAAARRLLEEEGAAMLEHSHQGLEGLLGPVKERLREFEARFTHTSEQDGKDRAALLEHLKGLHEAQGRLHADAQALSRALLGEGKAQGDWGELVLESLLSTAGLTHGREYELQVDHRDEQGAHKRPDALVYLPPDRVLIIDAKCSLTAFVASTRAATEAEREVDLAAHVQSVRSHVRALAQKDYQHVVRQRSIDSVLLFMPNEAAFHAALSRDASLYEDAFRQRVLLCSPTTLLAALQVVSHVWRSERQNLNAQRIAEEAGKMIDKLSAALESFSEVGDRLGRAQQAFELAKSRLSTGRGNVLALATRVVELGARPGRPERLEAAQVSLEFEHQADNHEGGSSARGVEGERRRREESTARARRRVDLDADDEAVP